MAGLKPFVADDLYLHRVIGGLSGGHGHSWVAFQVTRALRQSDGYSSRIWGLDLSSGARARPLTAADASATSPMFDSRAHALAFLRRSEKAGTQLHLLPMDVGESRALTDTKECTPRSIEGWSPDDCQLLVRASVQWTEDREQPPRNGGRAPEVVRYLPYKVDGAGIAVGRRTHLFAVGVDTGQLRALTQGDFDVDQAAWSPDGQQLVYVRNRTTRQRHRSDLWIARSDGSHARLLDDTLASISGVAWSPDGARLAVAGSETEGDSRVSLWLVEVASGQRSRLGDDDLEIEPVSGLIWHGAGDRIAVIASRRGLQEVTSVSMPDGRAVRLQKGLRHALQLAASGSRLAFVSASMRRLNEVHSMEWDGHDERGHTAFNRKWVSTRTRPRVSKRRFMVPDGAGGAERIEAWLLRPPEGAGPFPLLVDMHGGPHSVALVDFAAHTYWYELCSRGWAVIAPNPVGSGSYGRSFAQRLRGRWGELDLPQIEAAVRHLQQTGVADERVACTGKSYGGFLSAWAIGHSELFRAAVVCAPVSNITSHAGTSDTGFYVTPFAMGAELHPDPQRYSRLSPITHCHRATAATLILQGENDGRCPRGQAEELFANLIRCSSATAEMVIYPESTHAVAESGTPSHRLDYHQRLAEWTVRHAG